VHGTLMFCPSVPGTGPKQSPRPTINTREHAYASLWRRAGRTGRREWRVHSEVRDERDDGLDVHGRGRSLAAQRHGRH
jgi:hypothetical protein